MLTKRITFVLLLVLSSLYVSAEQSSLKREDILAKKFIPSAGRVVEDRWVFVFHPNVDEDKLNEISEYIEGDLGAESVQKWVHPDGSIFEWNHLTDDDVENVVETFYDYIKFAEIVTIQQFAIPKGVQTQVS